MSLVRKTKGLLAFIFFLATLISFNIYKHVNISKSNILAAHVTNTKCSNDDRQRLLQSQCVRHPNETIKTLSSARLYKLSIGIYVDLKHKILACIPAKSGCTTMKNVLANNSGDAPLRSGDIHVHVHSELMSRGVYPLHQFTKLRQRSILEDEGFFRFMVARHPLERLYSAFTSKFVPPVNAWFDRQYGRVIRARFHPDMPVDLQPNQMDPGFTFAEFIKFTQQPGGYDHHWDAVYNLCEPCVMRYHRILKTETMDADLADLVPLLPHGRGAGTKMNAVSKTGYSNIRTNERMQQAYSNVSTQDMDYLVKTFQNDLTHFGYLWSRGEGDGADGDGADGDGADGDGADGDGGDGDGGDGDHDHMTGGIQTQCSQRAGTGSICC